MKSRVQEMLSRTLNAYCGANGLMPYACLSADELMAELPDDPEFNGHRAWLSSFIELWDLSL